MKSFGCSAETSNLSAATRSKGPLTPALSRRERGPVTYRVRDELRGISVFNKPQVFICPARGCVEKMPVLREKSRWRNQN